MNYPNKYISMQVQLQETIINGDQQQQAVPVFPSNIWYYA